MKIVIKNLYFEKSPLSVDIVIEDIVKQGVRPFKLSLRNDVSASNVLAECVGVLFDEDINSLLKFLEELSIKGNSTLNYAPMEPSFMLRGQCQSNDVELLWVVDQGMAGAKYSTDTGVGVLMNISLKTLINITNEIGTLI